jgi:hypothetical protein
VTAVPRSFPIVQLPNGPLIATVLAAAMASGTCGQTSSVARLVSCLSLLLWSTEEIIDGANWFRRLLGGGGAAWAVIELDLSRRRSRQHQDDL